MAYAQSTQHHKEQMQLSLFDLSIPTTTPTRQPYIVTVTRIAPVAPSTDVAVAPKPAPVTSLNDWQRILALPVMILAAAWSSFSGEYKNPCKHVCNRKASCSSAGCPMLQAYGVGLDWKFGEEDGYATPTALAAEGGYRIMDI